MCRVRRLGRLFLMYVCATCGVESVMSGRGRLIHVDAIPRGYEVHEVDDLMDGDAWLVHHGVTSLKAAAEDMLVHHTTGHPESDCAFARNLRAALR